MVLLITVWKMRIRIAHGASLQNQKAGGVCSHLGLELTTFCKYLILSRDPVPLKLEVQQIPVL